MRIYNIFVVYNDGREFSTASYTSEEEANKHLAYVRSLPWCMREGESQEIRIYEVREKFEPWNTEEEIEEGRRWDEEHITNK